MEVAAGTTLGRCIVCAEPPCSVRSLYTMNEPRFDERVEDTIERHTIHIWSLLQNIRVGHGHGMGFKYIKNAYPRLRHSDMGCF